MINNILIKKVASYDDDGVLVENLKKVNFIYGSNGSGKTTISNLIADGSEKCFIDSCVTWEHGLELRGVVYNKRFRENNFGKGTIEGIFTLGEATKEELDILARKRNELLDVKEAGIQKKRTLEFQEAQIEKEEKSFRESTWIKVYKRYEHVFKEAFRGSMQMDTFKSKLLREFKENSSPLLELEELVSKSKTIFGEVPERLPRVPTFGSDELRAIEEDDMWKRKVLGKSDVDIAALIHRINANDWVNQGRLLLQDDETCPFCQQKTITDRFRKVLDDYFDESFIKSVDEIQRLSQKYGTLAESIRNQLEQLEAYENTNTRSKLDSTEFSSQVKTLSALLSINIERLDSKIKEPSRTITLVSTQEVVEEIRQVIGRANSEIKAHNEIADNYRSEKQSLISSIWKYIAEEYRGEIVKYNKTINGLRQGSQNLKAQYLEKRNEYQTLNGEITALSSNVTSIEPTINKINSTLRQFGFVNFEIVPSKSVSNHYQLLRQNGELAESSLSEGEITFITFLYFMQLAVGSTDRESIVNERVLVIDDPISSLDSTVLFVVSTLIKGVISSIKSGAGNIKQLILLTHNVYFHKEASFVNGREQSNGQTNYWILRKNNGHSGLQSFGSNNPIQTSYELLWKELTYKEHNSGITIQNTMRRIIENYFKILGKFGDDDLIHKFADREEQEICRSLLSWVNDGSHSVGDDLYMELQQDAVEKYLKVFKDIFVLTNHEGHYQMMMAD